MPPTVMHSPKLEFDTTPDAAATLVDLSCFAVAVDISADGESIDIGTFCTPGATEVGRVTESIVLAFLWEPDLYTALEPLIGVELEMRLFLEDTDTQAVIARCRFAALPWGRFEQGQRVEVDLQLAVLTTITYDTPVDV